MQKRLLLSTLFGCLLSVSVHASLASEVVMCDGFTANGANVVNTAASGINEMQFNEVLDKLQGLYQNEFASHGAVMDIRRHWSSNQANASSSTLGNYWFISMYGGFARLPGMNRDAFALAACHETGHHLGGSPRSIISIAHIASEGEADYFATLKCLREFFADEDNASVVASLHVEPFVVSECAMEFSTQADRLVCERSATAGMTIAHVLANLDHDKSVLSFQTPDQRDPIFISRQVHPRAQCRLDTYLNGARCPMPANQPLSNSSYWPGSCDRPNEPANTGSRPRCWFKPDGFTIPTVSSIEQRL